MADPNSLVLNQILSELQKLNDFERQSQRDAQSIMQVARADAQTPVSPSLTRQAGPGAQLTGSLSGSASTPDLLDTDALKQTTRRELGQAADEQIGGQRGGALADPRSEEAVAWSLLSEAGHGGALGRLRQAQYSVSRNLGVIGGLGGNNGPIANWQNRLGTAADSSIAAAGGPTATSTVLSGASQALQPLRTAGGWAQNLVDNHEMATTIASLSVASGRRAANQWYEMGAAMGFDPTTFGGPSGAGQAMANRQTTHAGEQVWQLIQQLRLTAGGTLRGLNNADAQALVGQLFEQGYTPGGTGLVSGGNMGAIAMAEAPAVHAMGQQGAEIAGSWNDALRSSNNTVSDLTQMLLQIPEAAHTAQLGLQRFNQSLQLVAQTITSMGGTATEGVRMGLQFHQLNPGLNPANAAALASSPLVQGFALGQGVLPSGIGAMPGGQFGNVSQQAVLMAVNAFQGVAPRQQYMTLPDGTRVPLNTPQAAVFQQAALQFPGMTPQDLRKIYDQARHPQRSAAMEQLQNVMGQQNMGMPTGIEAITHGRMGVGDWGHLTQQQRSQALQAWNTGIVPFLRGAGLDTTHIRRLNQTGNVNERIQMLNNMLPGAGGTGANQPGNAATVRIEVGLNQKAAQALSVTASAKGQAKKVQNAGGTTLNVTLNSPLGQNPTYGGIPNSSDNMGYGVPSAGP